MRADLRLGGAARRDAGSAADRPRVAVLEWLEPLFATGHWGPELVAIAGGMEMVGRSDAPSRSIDWTDVIDAAPDVLVIAACGLGIDRTMRELPTLASRSSPLPAGPRTPSGP